MITDDSSASANAHYSSHETHTHAHTYTRHVVHGAEKGGLRTGKGGRGDCRSLVISRHCHCRSCTIDCPSIDCYSWERLTRLSSDHIVIFDFRGFTYTRVRLLRLNKKYHKIVERSERDSDSEQMREGGGRGGMEWKGWSNAFIVSRVYSARGYLFFSRRVYEKSGARGGRRPSPFGIATIFQKTEGKKRREKAGIDGTFVRTPRASRWRGSWREEEGGEIKRSYLLIVLLGSSV